MIHQDVLDNIQEGLSRVGIGEKWNVFLEEGAHGKITLGLGREMGLPKNNGGLIDGIKEIMDEVLHSPLVNNRLEHMAQNLRDRDEELEKVKAERDKLLQYKHHYDLEFGLKHGARNAPKWVN